MSGVKNYILTITCPDTIGIVSTVSTFLAENGAFVTEAAQYGDPFSQRFFMRIVFVPGPQLSEIEALREKLSPIAQRFEMVWTLHDASVKSRVVLMVSKFGHCLNDLLHRYRTGSLPIDICAVISNHEDMRDYVEWHNIPYHCFPVNKETKSRQESQIMAQLDMIKPDLVVLARYMQILSPELCFRLSGKAINIHHSFLPSFKGAKPYHQAHDRGVKIIGATAHYVTTDLDEGPIIEQSVETVDHTQTPDDLAAIGRDIESLVLARAVRYHIEHRVILNGKRTVVFK